MIYAKGGQQTMPKVSIVIPVYKVEKYLPSCLDSVLSQSLQDIEVICIDDASPDRCPEMLDGYASKDPRVRVLHLPENHQQGYGRNRGTEMARGKYVYFLDSDDMITPEAMEELYTVAEKDNLGCIYFDSQVIFAKKELEVKNSTYITGRTGQYDNRVYSGRELFELFKEQNDWNCYVQRTFWRRDFLWDNEVFSPEHIEHEDEFFSFKGVLLAQRVRYIPKNYFIRRYREDSVMTRPEHPRDFHGYFVSFCSMVDFVEKMKIESKAADAEILHMYERMDRFFPLFSANEDPHTWFSSEEQLRIYYYYAYAKKMDHSYFKGFINKLTVPIPVERHIWIYGAGIVGKRVYEVMVVNGYIVDGFLVTNKEGNPRVLFGREVFQVDEIHPPDNCVAIVAVTGKARGEMQETLERLGWNYSVYITG